MAIGRSGTKAPRLGTAEVAAAEHGVSPRTVRRWTATGGAVGHRVLGGRLLIDLDSVTRKRYQRQDSSSEDGQQ